MVRESRSTSTMERVEGTTTTPTTTTAAAAAAAAAAEITSKTTTMTTSRTKGVFKKLILQVCGTDLESKIEKKILNTFISCITVVGCSFFFLIS